MTIRTHRMATYNVSLLPDSTVFYIPVIEGIGNDFTVLPYGDSITAAATRPDPHAAAIAYNSSIKNPNLKDKNIVLMYAAKGSTPSFISASFGAGGAGSAKIGVTSVAANMNFHGGSTTYTTPSAPPVTGGDVVFMAGVYNASDKTIKFYRGVNGADVEMINSYETPGGDTTSSGALLLNSIALSVYSVALLASANDVPDDIATQFTRVQNAWIGGRKYLPISM